jgi:hypothetical protein
MTTWEKKFEKYIPPTLAGYDFVSRIQVFIPLKIFGVNILERQVHSLTFVYSSIMTSVQCGNRQIPKLAELFGVPNSIMLQIVSQMDTQNLVSISAGEVVLTPEGRSALDTLTKIQIQRRQLNNLYLNQITGEMSEKRPSGVYTEPPRDHVYLHENHLLTADFLQSKFDELSFIYKESQVDSVVFGAQSTLDTELYRILDVVYEELVYISEGCFVYLNQEDKSLSFKFASGIQIYEDSLQKQLSQQAKLPGVQRLLSKPVKKPAPIERQIKSVLPVMLITATKQHGEKHIRQQIIEDAYFSDRPLLDGEIADILLHANEKKSEEVFIKMPYLYEYLTPSVISILAGMPTIRHLILCHDNRDKSSERIIKDLKSSTRNRKNFTLTIVPLGDVWELSILLGNYCAIRATFEEVETVYRRKIYRTCAEITFDSLVVKSAWNAINKNFISLTMQ